MECAPNINIFRELQVVLDTGYFSGQISPEEDWQQVRFHIKIYKYPIMCRCRLANTQFRCVNFFFRHATRWISI